MQSTCMSSECRCAGKHLKSIASKSSIAAALKDAVRAARKKHERERERGRGRGVAKAGDHQSDQRHDWERQHVQEEEQEEGV